MPRLLELFCGTKSISKVFKDWEVISVDIDPQFEPTICADILDLSPYMFDEYGEYGKIDFIWASPPCTTFSVSSIGRHWNKDHTPKTKAAEQGLYILHRTMKLIERIKPSVGFIIENPRGKMRKMPILDGLKRYTVTYCQYGDFRMKPTDLWSNLELEFLPPCNNGDSCHVSAPRGSRTGTQGMGTAIQKGVIPEQLAQSIYEQINNRRGNSSSASRW